FTIKVTHDLGEEVNPLLHIAMEGIRKILGLFHNRLKLIKCLRPQPSALFENKEEYHERDQDYLDNELGYEEEPYRISNRKQQCYTTTSMMCFSPSGVSSSSEVVCDSA